MAYLNRNYSLLNQQCENALDEYFRRDQTVLLDQQFIDHEIEWIKKNKVLFFSISIKPKGLPTLILSVDANGVHYPHMLQFGIIVDQGRTGIISDEELETK